MSEWVWALNDKGLITKCYSLPELRGKGRCNHIFFQNYGETESHFVKRVNERDKEIKEQFSYNINSNNVEKNLIIGGAQTKIHDIKNDIFIKIDSEKNEGLVEDFISNILNLSNLPCVQYESCELYKDEKDTNLKGCRSKNFITSNHSEVNIRNLLSSNELKELYKNTLLKDQYEYMMNKIQYKTDLNYREYFNKILCLDIITMNHDRHIENLTLLYDNENQKYKIPSCFDNGCCFDNVGK